MWPNVPAWWLPAVQAFVQSVQPVFFSYGQPVTVSSWGRTLEHNAIVGGVSDSQHLLWTAADLVPADGDMASLADFCRQLPGIGYVLDEGNHVHVQAYPAGYVPAWVFQAVAV